MTNEAMVCMPDFCDSSHGFHHTVDSALDVLSELGIPPARITVRMAGRGWQPFWVVEQLPQAGLPLGSDASIVLHVSGLGLFHSLPVGMWDRGGDTELGTKEILELFDDPMQKAAHWIREGEKLFDLRPDRANACASWISLFGLNPEDWPPQSWYKLATLLPSLHYLAGKEEGIRLALHLLLNLPLQEICKQRAYSYLDDDDLSLLGWKASRLAVDAVAGNLVEDLECLLLVIGPVPLETYYRFQEQADRRLLTSALDLCLPCHQKHRVLWSVLDPARAPRLGFETENARLGINSHLGLGTGAVAAGPAAADASPADLTSRGRTHGSDASLRQGQREFSRGVHEVR